MNMNSRLGRCLDACNEALLRTRRWPDIGPEPQVTFIVGAPRSGTTLLYEAMASACDHAYIPNVMNLWYGAPLLAMRMERRWVRPRNWGFQSLHGHVHGWLAPSEHAGLWRVHFPWARSDSHRVEFTEISAGARARLRAILRAMTAIAERPLLVKCLYLSMCIPALAELLPKARFIHVQRQRLHAAQSLLHLRRARGGGSRWLSVRPPGYRAQLNTSLPEQVAWQIHQCEVIVSRDLSALPSARSFCLDYEEFCARPRQVVASMTQALGLGAAFVQLDRLPNSFESRNRPVGGNGDLESLKAVLSRLGTQADG